MIKIYFILFLIFTQIPNLYGYKIYMIRHGEKIDDKHIGLSKYGINRSNKIRDKFSKSKYKIKYLYAQEYDEDTKKRIRPYLTLKPLSKKMKINIDVTCDRDDIDCIKRKILKSYKKGNILLSWEHDNLQKIADKLISELNIKDHNLKQKLKNSNKGYDFLWIFENNNVEIIDNYINDKII